MNNLIHNTGRELVALTKTTRLLGVVNLDECGVNEFFDCEHCKRTEIIQRMYSATECRQCHRERKNPKDCRRHAETEPRLNLIRRCTEWENKMETILNLGAFGIIAALVAYFIPTLIAGGSNRKSGCAILALNLFLGWTFLGWLVALVWALSDDS